MSNDSKVHGQHVGYMIFRYVKRKEGRKRDRRETKGKRKVLSSYKQTNRRKFLIEKEEQLFPGGGVF